jgi:hypothetical protein
VSAAAPRDKAERFIRSYWPAAVALLLLGGAVYWAFKRDWIGLPPLLAMTIGGVVGVVEIMARYRYAPLRAALSWSGYVYVLVNIVGSGIAFYLLVVFWTDQAQQQDAKELVKLVVAAGFGSLVVLRSSVFKVRVGDTDVGIGPAAVLDTLLLIADRGVDRREAVSRAQDVSALVSHVKDYRVVANMLTKYSLALMQNVDEKTSKDLGDAIGKILGDSEIPDAIKMDIVALRLGVVVGPDVLEAAVEALGDRLKAGSQNIGDGTPPAPRSVATPSAAELKAEIDSEFPRQPTGGGPS